MHTVCTFIVLFEYMFVLDTIRMYNLNPLGGNGGGNNRLGSSYIVPYLL